MELSRRCSEDRSEATEALSEDAVDDDIFEFYHYLLNCLDAFVCCHRSRSL
jgi:hypothetical protein